MHLRNEVALPNPAKHQHVIDEYRFVNVLAGTLSDGTTGSKVIWYDERTGRASSSITICRPDGVMATVEGATVTAIRCGLLAALALESVFEVGEVGRVGIRGYGRLGQAIHDVLMDLTPHRIQPIYSPRQSAITPPLNAFDALITATSLRYDPPLEFDPLARTRAYIAFDSALSLGPSFRERTITHSDHPEQLLAHWGDEFPGETPPVVHPLLEPVGEGPVSYYCFGVAVADLVVARGLLWNE